MACNPNAGTNIGVGHFERIKRSFRGSAHDHTGRRQGVSWTLCENLVNYSRRIADAGESFVQAVSFEEQFFVVQAEQVQ